MAVRQGEILKENIFLKLFNKPLKSLSHKKTGLFNWNISRLCFVKLFLLSLHSRLCWCLKVFIDKVLLINLNSLIKNL